MWIGTTFAFFQRFEKVFLRLQFLNMIESEWFYYIFITHFQHSYGYLIVPIGLVDIKCLTYFVYIFIFNIKRWHFCFCNICWFSDNLLSFGKGLHWDEKYLLKRFAFSLKFVINLQFNERGGIIGIFLLL